MRSPILIADDNPDDLFFARRAVQKALPGAQVVTCADGREVVEVLTAMTREEKPVPQAVLLDIKMPNMDGFQTLQWIRGQQRLAGVRVIILSGSGEPKDIALARSLGATDYLVKYPPAAEFARAMGAAG